MLQTLLKDRFQLQIRPEEKTLSAYALSVAKGGPKLKASALTEKECLETPDACHAWSGGQGRGIHTKGMDMADLAVFLEQYSDRPIVDATGLKGLYEIDTEGWVPLIGRVGPVSDTPEGRALGDSARPTLAMVLDKLGLKLESTKAPIKTYAIEHVERPSAN